MRTPPDDRPLTRCGAADDVVEEADEVAAHQVERVAPGGAGRPALAPQVDGEALEVLGQQRQRGLVAPPRLGLAGDEQQRRVGGIAHHDVVDLHLARVVEALLVAVVDVGGLGGVGPEGVGVGGHGSSGSVAVAIATVRWGSSGVKAPPRSTSPREGPCRRPPAAQPTPGRHRVASAPTGSRRGPPSWRPQPRSPASAATRAPASSSSASAPASPPARSTGTSRTRTR